MKRKSAILVVLFIIGVIFTFSCNREASSKPMFLFKIGTQKDVVAKINGTPVTQKELYKGVENEIYEAEMKLHNLKMNRLKAMLLEKFMNSDPKKMDLTNDKFLDKYICKNCEPTAAEIAAFIKERKIPKAQITEQIKERIKQFMGMDKKRKAVDDWLKSKTAKNPVEVYLQKPKRPVFDIKLGDSPFWGGEKAKVTVIEFTDYECPFCSKGHVLMNELKKYYGKKIKIAMKHNPLPYHKKAKDASNASFCANEQGKKYLFKISDLLFENQKELEGPKILEYAKIVGLNMDKFKKCQEEKRYIKRIGQDIKEANRLQISSVPIFFINGIMISGAQDIETFKEIIDLELKKK